jgi:hypothetical protein
VASVWGLVGCCCSIGRRVMAFVGRLGDLVASDVGDLGASFWHFGAPRPKPRQGCVRTHPWTPPQGLCPLTPLVRGSPQAPRMPERFALSRVARPWIVGGATSFRVATRSLHRSRGGGLDSMRDPGWVVWELGWGWLDFWAEATKQPHALPILTPIPYSLTPLFPILHSRLLLSSARCDRRSAPSLPHHG